MKKSTIITTIILLAIFAFIWAGELGCLVKRTIGIPCPVCGFTRALRFASAMDFANAFRMHPLWPLLLCLIFIIIAVSSPLVKAFPWLRAFINNKFVIATFAILIAITYIIRMLTLFPETPPMNLYKDALLLQFLI